MSHYEEFHCSVSLSWASPKADEEEHWDEDEFPEDVEGDKVERCENSYDCTFEEEEQRIVLLDFRRNLIP